MSEDTARDSAYTVVNVIKEVITSPKSEKQDYENKIAALIQKKRRPDGKMGGEFVNVKAEIRGKVFFFSVPAAKELLAGLQEILPGAVAEDKRLKEEYEERRKRYTEDWEKQISEGAKGTNGAPRTGKTERDKKKENWKSSDKRKQEKAERDREIRLKMRSNKGG